MAQTAGFIHGNATGQATWKAEANRRATNKTGLGNRRRARTDLELELGSASYAGSGALSFTRFLNQRPREGEDVGRGTKWSSSSPRMLPREGKAPRLVKAIPTGTEKEHR